MTSGKGQEYARSRWRQEPKTPASTHGSTWRDSRWFRWSLVGELAEWDLWNMSCDECWEGV